MVTIVGLLELAVFMYMARRTLIDRDYMINNVLFVYLCQIFNYKFLVQVPWINIGISLYAQDFLILLMLLILLLGKYPIPKCAFSIAILLFTLMAIQSAIRGVFVHGFSSDCFADIRKYMYFTVGTLYYFCVPINKDISFFEKKITKVFNFLTVYALIMIFFYMIGMPLGERSSNRPILADFAIIYAVFTGYKLYKDLVLSESKKIRIPTLIYIITLILNRFNTTWVALFIAIGVLFIFKSVDKNSGRFSWKLGAQILVICIGVFIFINVGENNILMEHLSTSMGKFNASENNTFSSRLEVWAACLAATKGEAAVIGFPFGNGFYVPYRGGIWPTIPHSGYVETIMRTGYVGMALLLLAVMSVIMKSFTKKVIYPAMVCVMMLVYWYAYQLTLEQGFLLGVCAQYVYYFMDWRVEYEIS